MERCEKAKAAKPEKLVDFDELREREWRLREKTFSWQEKIFEALIDFPHKAYLFVRRSVGEAIDFVRGRDRADKAAAIYEDILSDRLYMNREMMESDIRYHLRHGLKRSFQEKAADTRRRAFEECRDFGFLHLTGQLRPLRQNS